MDETVIEEEEGVEKSDLVREMFDATYHRVDAVSGPASQLKFVVLKAGQQQDSAAINEIRAASSGDPKEAPVTKATQTAEAPAPVDAPELQIVAKADDLTVTEVLAEPDKGDPPADEEPGSPGWEAVDAATARKWTAILSRAKNALQVLADREALEVAVGESDDGGDAAFDLTDASCAVDYAISVLAPFAVDEQSEVDNAPAETVAKAMLEASATLESDLDVIEGLGPVKKAGRVLSSANEEAIRGAVVSLQNVLNSLPPAPPEVVGTSPVAKSKEPVMEDEETQPVAKAKGDPMVACYDAQGRLLGAVDAADLTPLSAGTPVDDEKADAPDDAPPPPAEDAEPDPMAPPAPAPVPEEPVAKSQDHLAEAIKAAVTEAIKAATEEHSKVVKSLEDRLETVERQPAGGGPLLSGLTQGGLTPTSGGHLALRGQGEAAGSPEVESVRKQLAASTDPMEQARLSRLLAFETLKTRYQ